MTRIRCTTSPRLQQSSYVHVGPCKRLLLTDSGAPRIERHEWTLSPSKPSPEKSFPPKTWQNCWDPATAHYPIITPTFRGRFRPALLLIWAPTPASCAYEGRERRE
mmetsp:Transcript_1900/g.3915  ORF Transcript_1900/g.3915 Transcript_1900/m.3915 type:complete len:106 (+) Transcript_1900:176-493(+)